MRLRPCPTGALVGVVLAALAPARGAATLQAQPPPRAEVPPVFGAGVQLVRLDVVVLDGDGRPVTGL